MASQKKRDEMADRKQDTAVEDSFPASDPPAHSGIVGPRGQQTDSSDRTPPHNRGEEARPKGTPTDERHAMETAHVWENEEKPPQRS
jgi:hypothetical protein